MSGKKMAVAVQDTGQVRKTMIHYSSNYRLVIAKKMQLLYRVVRNLILTSPPGVSRVPGCITKAMSKEQSMVLRISDLNRESLGMAYKTLYWRYYVSGQLPPGYGCSFMVIRICRPIPIQDSSRVRVFIRFGADANNYYEYGQDIYAGWTS